MISIYVCLVNKIIRTHNREFGRVCCFSSVFRLQQQHLLSTYYTCSDALFALISSIRDEEQKFLGKLLFFKGKPEKTFNLVKDTFVKGIERIGEAMVRDEFKLWMYTN